MTPPVKKLMVTGASGFIGARSLAALAGSSYEVHAVSTHLQPALPTLPEATWHVYDMLDARQCVEAVAAIRPTHLLHLAWIATPGEFWSSPRNLEWLEAGKLLADAFHRNGGARSIGVGSCAEYEWGEGNLKEDATPLRPDSVYGRAKVAMSVAFEEAARRHGGSTAWARLFFPYGPGEPPGKLIPAVIRGLLRGEEVPCTHGNQVRDFIYVDDVVSGLVKLLDSSRNGAFNVASGTGTSLREVVGMITRNLGRPELVRFGARPAPADDPQRVVADVSKLRQTGWRPAMDLKQGIERSIAAWRERAIAEGKQ